MKTSPTRSGLTTSVPDDLRRLRGPLTGVVHLPLELYSSGQGPDFGWDLSREPVRIELYEIVLTGGRTEHMCAYLDLLELVRLWPRLWLPDDVRAVWETRLRAERLL